MRVGFAVPYWDTAREVPDYISQTKYESGGVMGDSPHMHERLAGDNVHPLVPWQVKYHASVT